MLDITQHFRISRSNADRIIAEFSAKCSRTSRYFQNDLKTLFIAHLARRRSQEARSEKGFSCESVSRTTRGKKENVFSAVPSVLLSTRCALFESALKRRIQGRKKNKK